MLRSGVRNQCPQKGEFCSSTALEVAVLCLMVEGIDGMAAAQYQAFAGQQVRLGIELVIECEYVLGCFVVTIFQAFIANRYELAFIAGSTAAFGKPVYGVFQRTFCSPSMVRWI